MPSMTLTVSANDWPDYRKYFLLAYPNNTTMSDAEWVQHKILTFALSAYKKGLNVEFYNNSPEYNEKIIRVI